MWQIAGIGVLAVAVGLLVFLAFQNTPDPATGSPNPQQRPTPTVAPTTEPAPETLAVTHPANGPLRVLFAGDSLTAGYYATTEADSFVARVVARLDDAGPVQVSKGDKAGAGLKEVADLVKIEPGLDLAVIELGTNDVPDGAATSFRDQYATLLARVRQKNPETPLLCVGTWASGSDNGYDGVIQQECAEVGGVFVPTMDLRQDPANHGPEERQTFRGLSDTFHPNDRGHRLIAAAILERLDLS